MQGTTRGGSGLRAQRVDQGSVAQAVGCCGAAAPQGQGTGHTNARQGSGLGTQGAVERRSPELWGQGTARALSREPRLGCWSGLLQGLRGCEGVEFK